LLSQAQPLPLGLNPELLVADPPADHLTLISPDFTAPSGVHMTLADGTSCQVG
jgi:hypothetical protein